MRCHYEVWSKCIQYKHLHVRTYEYLLSYTVSTVMLVYIFLLPTHIPITTGISVVPNFIPPSEKLSNTPAQTGSTRFNLNKGASFIINCTITHTSDKFTGYFYKDGVVISDGYPVNTTLMGPTVHSTTQSTIHLQFLNFQPVHDGVYHCFANTSDTNEEVSSDLYLYGSGEDCMCAWSGKAMCEVE